MSEKTKSTAPWRRLSAAVLMVGVVVFAANVAAEEPDQQEVAEEADDPEQEGEEDEVVVDEPTPQMYVMPTSGLEGEVSEIVTERINEVIRDRVDTVGGVELIPALEALRGGGGIEDTHAALQQAESQYTSGIGLVRAGEYEDAANVLQQAYEVFVHNVTELRDFGLLTDAMANLAVAYYETGYDLDARDLIEHYAQLNPEAELDPEVFPVELIERFQSEVQHVERAGEGQLSIESNHDPAQVYIDGELVGETPLVVEDIGYGERFVVVERGEKLWSDTIAVRARGEEQTVTVELRHRDELEEEDDQLPSYYLDLLDDLRSGQFGPEVDPFLQELSRETGADYITWVIVVPEGADYAAIPFVFRVEDREMIRGSEEIFDSQLTNVRSQADALSDSMAAAVVHMPEAQQVREVNLVEEREPEEVEEEPVAQQEVDPDEQEVEEEPEVAEEELTEEDEQEVAMHQPDEQLPVPEQTQQEGMGEPTLDEPTDGWRGNRMRYLGWGSAAVAATGLAAGAIVFFVRRAGDSAGPGFDVEVEW